MKFRARAASFFALSLPLLAGCSTSRIAVNLMVPILENTTDAALRSPDARLVGDAMPTTLILLEGMLETHPRQKEVARLASMMYFAYAFGFVEDKDPTRASGLYDRGRELGWRAFADDERESAIREGNRRTADHFQHFSKR